ncbi:MAG: hypothetical protein P4N60_17655 [Verrucomicrobiae bacterium]|nr:hypothetical protein [Verrucomicrobiae bacterium]
MNKETPKPSWRKKLLLIGVIIFLPLGIVLTYRALVGSGAWLSPIALGLAVVIYFGSLIYGKKDDHAA